MPAETGYRLTLEVEGLEAVEEEIGPKRLARDLGLIHRKLAFMSLAHTIRTCSVDTGRARAGFLALFKKHGVSADREMRRPPPGGSMGRTDPRAVSDGESKGRVDVDRPFEIQITNAVEYVEYINSGTSRMAGTGFLDKTILKTVDHAQKVIDWYTDQVLLGKEKATDRPDQGPGEIPT